MPTIRSSVVSLCFYCVALLSGCSVWSDWKPYDRYRDLPYANGKVVGEKFRTRKCAMCTTGSTGETAFFGDLKKYYEKDIGEKASAFLMQVAAKEKWSSLGKSFTGNEQFFSPIRIFVPSLDPIIVITIPWKYKTNLSSPFVLHDLFEEGCLFAETIYRPYTYIPQYWPRNIRVPIEIRGSLPAEAIQVRVITKDFDSTIEITRSINGTKSIDVGKQTLIFTRAERKVLVSFAPH